MWAFYVSMGPCVVRVTSISIEILLLPYSFYTGKKAKSTQEVLV